MTQEEILEYNKRCAEFLGALYSENADAWGFGNARNLGSKIINDRMYHNVIDADRYVLELKYHSDWNWIMEVVEAIESTPVLNSKYASDYNVVFDSFGLYIESTGYHSATIVQVDNPSKKEAVIQGINKFLLWYNENKK